MIRKQPFGRTGHESTATLFGAAALGSVTQEEADNAFEVLQQYDVNHLDTAASYGDAELRMGAWPAGWDKDRFIATKTGERTYQAAKESISRSLERMRIDKVDLIQLHNLVHPDDWDVALGPGGALEAAIEAREQGLVRFIGVTGHGLTAPTMHRRSLERFDFDSVLFPMNFPMMQNQQYAEDAEKLISLCEDRGVAVQIIKSITRGPWATTERSRATWYQPLEEQDQIDLAVHWILGRQGLFLNTAGDIHVLPKVLNAASRFVARPSDEAMLDLVAEAHMTPLFGG